MTERILTPRTPQGRQLTVEALEFFQKHPNRMEQYDILQIVAELLAIRTAPKKEPGPVLEPYGYCWFNRHMEYRFTHRLPHPESSEQPIGEVTPVYKAPPSETAAINPTGPKHYHAAPSAIAPLTDRQIMNAACTAADALDATRVSEMKNGGWHATTIFDGDTGLLRFGRLIEKAINGR